MIHYTNVMVSLLTIRTNVKTVLCVEKEVNFDLKLPLVKTEVATYTYKALLIPKSLGFFGSAKVRKM